MSDSRSSSFDRQYKASQVLPVFADLLDWSSVTVAGADRQKLLNNFCTNDVQRLTTGESCEAFFCNVKGKIIGHGLVTCRDCELVVIGPPAQAAPLAAHLDRYVIREDVQIRDTTAERAYLLVAGAKARDDLPSAHNDAKLFPWRLIENEYVALVELSPPDKPAVMKALPKSFFVPFEQEVFGMLRIEAGTPLFGVDFDSENFPQEVGRDKEAISFTKGCYLGQETVARIDALGHVNQKIVGVAFSGADVPAVGTELTAARKTVGRVTSATFSPALNRPLALAMVRREHNAVGSPLDSPVGKCEVVALPVAATHAAT